MGFLVIPYIYSYEPININETSEDVAIKTYGKFRGFIYSYSFDIWGKKIGLGWAERKEEGEKIYYVEKKSYQNWLNMIRSLKSTAQITIQNQKTLVNRVKIEISEKQKREEAATHTSSISADIEKILDYFFLESDLFLKDEKELNSEDFKRYRINGNLTFSHSSLKKISDVKSKGCSIEKENLDLVENMKIDGLLYCYKSNVNKFRNITAKEVNIQNCNILTTLENFDVKGFFNVLCSNAKEISHVKSERCFINNEESLNLVENMKINGRLQCHDSKVKTFRNITAKEVDIQNCYELETLENFDVEGDFSLVKCPKVKTLPQMNIGGDLDLFGTSIHENVPEWIFKLGPKRNGQIRKITLLETGQDRTKYENCPGIEFEFLARYQYIL